VEAADIAERLSGAQPILFTGAGFSVGARAVDGDPLPSSRQLRDLLWPIAFPDAEPDRSTLQDVYDCAVAADPDRTQQVLERRLTVDAESLDDSFRCWFAMPWARHYTLNVDDLCDAVSRRFDLPRPIVSVSALGSPLPARVDGLLSIHLNGRMADFPNITFTHLQYGHRTAQPDPWYQHLAADLATSPAVFVGTSLAEPPLWQQLALHPGTDDRPPSFIVTTRMPRARREVLRRLHVEWVPMSASAFAADVLPLVR